MAPKIIRGVKTTAGLAIYNNGPLWNTGYKWINVFWGSYWNNPKDFTVAQVNTATQHIATDASYWGGLSEYAVAGKGDLGYGVFGGYYIISQDPPSKIDDTQIALQLSQWVKAGTLPDVNEKGAYNIFFPPGVTVTLGGSSSCSVFCDYHNFYNDSTKNYYYTVEPYPCTLGCNQCTTSPFDTLTQGMSEEFVEMATDSQPGTGWVVGNEELADVCDAHFVCHQISTGEYVNAWYSNKYNTCWVPQWPPNNPQPPPPSTCPVAKVFTTTYNTFAKLLHRKTRLFAVVPVTTQQSKDCNCS